MLKRPRYPGWAAAAALLAAVVLTPYIPLVAGPLVRGLGESWGHIVRTVLPMYLRNTVVLVIGSVVPATVIGVAGAWIVERYEFAGRRVITILFAAPLALPVYVATYTWAGIFAFGGVVERTTGLNVPFAGIPAAAAVLALGLYPYVFLTVRAALVGSARSLLEAVASLSPAGGGRARYLGRVARGVLPTLWPAIAGGAFLVGMEVMNAYATPVYLGVHTLSTGVFRTWLGLADLEAASTLALLVFVIMLAAALVDRLMRGRRRFAPPGGAPAARVRLSPAGLITVWLVLLIPIAAGFLLPMAQIVGWSVARAAAGAIDIVHVAQVTVRTVALAAGATAVIVTVAFLIAWARYLTGTRAMRLVARLASVGYTVPGTVVAIGVLAVFAALRRFDERLFLFGTVGGLIFAYLARYLAVALQPIDAAFERRHRSVVDAARSLGHRPLSVLRRIVLPLFRPTMASAALLVAIDVIKDLPMTLLLRPFDFDTLAIEVYALASDERVADAAPAALLLVAVGILTILVVMLPSLRKGAR